MGNRLINTTVAQGEGVVWFHLLGICSREHNLDRNLSRKHEFESRRERQGC
jgi:hypothetical protein